MTALRINVVLLEENTLVEVGIEIMLHQRIGHIRSPTYKMVHSLLGAVGIVNLQSVTQCHYIITHCLQAVGSYLGKQSRRFQVSVNPCSYEVIGSEITDFQNSIRHSICQGYELTGILREFGFGIFFLFLIVDTNSHHNYTNGKEGECNKHSYF